MSDVFISHSSKDKAIADKVVKFLEDKGLSCWISSRDIVPGTEWAAAINTAITSSKVFLIIYTANSAESGQVVREVSLAESKQGVFVVPYKTDETPLKDSFEYYLTGSHFIAANYAKKDYKLEELYNIISGIVGKHIQNITNNTYIENLHIEKSANKSKLPLIIGIISAAIVVVVIILIFVNISGKNEEETTLPTDNEASVTPVPSKEEETLTPTESEPSPVPSKIEETPTPTEPEPSPVPTEIKETPTPTEPESSPVPTEIEETPIPTESEPSPIPSKVEETPTPTKPEPTPVPSKIEETPTPTEPETTPVPTKIEETPTPTESEPSPIPTEIEETPTPTEPENTPIPTEIEETPTPTKPETAEYNDAQISLMTYINKYGNHFENESGEYYSIKHSCRSYNVNTDGRERTIENSMVYLISRYNTSQTTDTPLQVGVYNKDLHLHVWINYNVKSKCYELNAYEDEEKGKNQGIINARLNNKFNGRLTEKNISDYSESGWFSKNEFYANVEDLVSVLCWGLEIDFEELSDVSFAELGLAGLS